ncbi:MAG: hypothetical protein ACRDH2_06810, partial [Anaerolineales bacterium]
MNFDFGDVLARAWRITWNNKILWLFGILSALGGSGSEGAQLRFGNDFDFSPGPGAPPQLPPPVERFFERLQEGDPVVVGVILGLVCVGIIIAVIFFVLSIIGRGGLIGGVQLANASGRVTFGEAWAMGQRNFWRLFVIGLLIGLITLGAALFLALPGTIC